MIMYKSVNIMLLTLNLIRIEIGKFCRGTVRSTDTSATGTEPRQAELLSLKTCRGTVRVAVQSVNRDWHLEFATILING